MKVRSIILGAVVVVSVFALAGCSTQARAERKGKAAGDEICRAKDGSSVDETQRHLSRADDKLDDLARFTGRDVGEDVRDLKQNLNQMSRGSASEQDINAIIRSVQDARASTRGNAAAAYDGMLEALANCE